MHYSVLVIADDVEKALAPYHEYECTGVNDKYVTDVDATEEYREYWQKYNNEGLSFKEYLEADEITTDGEYTRYELAPNGEVSKVIRRTNPNAQWDWYEIGGRWSDLLINTEGEHCDSALHKNIDWSAMEHDCYVRAARAWDEAHKEKNDTTYRAFVFGIKEGMTRDEFIAQEANWCTYAVLRNGTWYTRDRPYPEPDVPMDEWRQTWTKLLSDVGPEERMTIVDIHI